MPNSAFDEPIIELANAHTPAIIQVIGVGGGGGNAVAHMYREGFMDVQYTVVNSDKKALSDSPVPDRVQLGPGLGAGGNPEKGRELCEESIEAVRSMLGKQTQMVFITAGMGGGTGTGASPIIAREARERGILTIGVVTIPFLFELTPRINKALDGVYALAKEVDALLVINNERLRDIYPELSVYNAFRRADDTLLTAVKSIVDIICMHGTMILDFCDVDTVLRGGRVAIMSTAYAEGERRVTKAINAALHSPLLNNNDIFNSKKIIISITSSNAKPLGIEELSELDAFMRKFRPDVITKYGLATDNGLDDKVKITILASGFGLYDKAERQAEEQRPKPGDIISADGGERLISFYGNLYGKPAKPRPRIYLIGTDDLSNEALLEEMERVPTARRSKEDYDRICNRGTAKQ